MTLLSEAGARAHGRSALMISPQFHPIVGGYERAAARVSAALAGKGMCVVVVAERRERAWPAMEDVDGYVVMRLFCVHQRHLHLLTSLLSVSGFLLRRGRSFDLWHVHQYGHHAALAVVLGRLLNRPVVLSLTSTGAMGISKAMGGGLVGRILRSLHRRVDACIALSAETCDEARAFGIPPGRIRVIPHGVDGECFLPATAGERAAARKELRLDCRQLALFVGRLAPEKNPLGLLEAWAGVPPAARAGAMLALVGDGPQREAVLMRAQERSLAGSVALPGMRDDVARWYRAADFLVVPSTREGLSTVMIEALAAGLPVVSTRVSGSSILLESPAAGIVVDSGNTQELARALERFLVELPLRTALGLNARSKFERSFSLGRNVEATALLYEELLDRSERPSHPPP